MKSQSFHPMWHNKPLPIIVGKTNFSFIERLEFEKRTTPHNYVEVRNAKENTTE
jgi:hypothetical protein